MSAALPRAELCREPGGEVLLCHSRRDVPLVHVELRLPGGRAREPLPLPGLGHLAADLLAEGPAGMSPAEWHRRTERLAAEVECDSRLDRWALRTSCLPENLAEACALLGQLLAAPGLPRSEWRRLVKSRRAEARESWAQPVAVIRQLAAVQSLGFAHPGAHPAFEKAFARAGHADGAKLAAGALRRGPGILAMIGGDVAPEEGLSRLRELLTALPAGGEAPPAELPAKPSARIWLADDPRVDQAFFALSRDGVRAGEPDRVALRLANYLIGGGGFESRLMDRVREKAGGTYGISSQLPERRLASPFVIQSFTRVERLAEMLKIVEDTLAELAAAGFTAKELDAARSNRFGALPLRLTSPRAVLDFAAEGLDAGLEPEDLERDWQAYRTVPPEAVSAAARRLVGDGRFRLAVIGPAAKVRSQLEGRGEAAIFSSRLTPDRWPEH